MINVYQIWFWNNTVATIIAQCFVADNFDELLFQLYLASSEKIDECLPWLASYNILCCIPEFVLKWFSWNLEKSVAIC